jgi:hypothetical protein
MIQLNRVMLSALNGSDLISINIIVSQSEHEEGYISFSFFLILAQGRS